MKIELKEITGVACKNINRKFIGIEKELEYFNIAKKRIKETVYQPELFKEVLNG